jgi:hypothetical protein
MPPVHLLYDVQPTVLTLCKQGANRQRIFLKKECGEGKAEVELNSRPELIRKADGDDWSYFYCVVAEPGNLEDAGVGDGAGSGIDDMWRDEEEIRKAAHFFATSDQLVTGLHDTVEPFGAVVENAVALADIDIMDPNGVMQTIKKGSWYVGIRPSDEGKAKIDAGEFTGLSLEGSGYRELVDLQKAEQQDKRSLLRKIAEAIGVEFDTPEELQKEDATFSSLMTADEIEDAFENAVGVLRRVMWNVTAPNFEGDRQEVIKTSVQQFADFISALATRAPDNSAQALAKELGTLEPEPEEEDPVADTDKRDDILEELRKEQSATSTAINKLAGLTEKLVEHLTQKPEPKAGEGEGEGASAADLKKSIDELTETVNSKLDELEAGVDALADQGSTQHTDPDELRKQQAREKNPLAGILD